MIDLTRKKKTGSTLGFTMIEALVYIAILVVVSTGSITLLLSLDELFVQYRVQQELLTTGAASMERILTELRQAESVDVGNSEFASSTAGALALDTGATTTTFMRTASGTLLVSVNGTEQGALNTSNVTVDGFTVYRYVLSKGELIRVKLAITATVKDSSDSVVLYGGAIIRGSYD